MADTNDTGNPQASNSLVVDRTNIHVQTLQVETVANVYPGAMVIQGTNDDDILVAGSDGKVIGWAGYEDTPKKYRPASRTTIYVVLDKIAVVNGPGIKLMALLSSGATVDKGTGLMVTTSGELTGATIGTNNIVAIAEESKASTTARTPILVRSLI